MAEKPLVVERSAAPWTPLLVITAFGAVAMGYLVFTLPLNTLTASSGILLLPAFLFFTGGAVVSGWFLLNPTRYEFYDDYFHITSEPFGRHRYSDIEGWWVGEGGDTAWIKLGGSDELIHMTYRAKDRRILTNLFEEKDRAEHVVELEGRGAAQAKSRRVGAEPPYGEKEVSTLSLGTPGVSKDVQIAVLKNNVGWLVRAETRWIRGVVYVGAAGLISVILGMAIFVLSPTVSGLGSGGVLMFAGVGILVIDYALVWPRLEKARGARKRARREMDSLRSEQADA